MPSDPVTDDVSFSPEALGPTVPGVTWRYVPSSEWPAEADAVAALSNDERYVLGSLRHPDRRRQWLAGRYVAKQLLRDVMQLGEIPLASIRISSRDAAGKGSPPVVLVQGSRLAVRLSLAHTVRGVLVACGAGGVPVGVDLVDVSEARPAALATWFTPAEAAAIDETSPDEVAEQWAVKEAVYKSVCLDESFAPKQVEAVRTAEGWRCGFFGRRIANLNVNLWRIDAQVAVLAALLQSTEAISRWIYD